MKTARFPPQLPETRTPEQIESDFAKARLVKNCPGCGEIIEGSFSFHRCDPFFQPFGDAYPNAGVGYSYCPNCDVFLEAWGRGTDYFQYEISCRRWRWNASKKSMVTHDLLFGKWKAVTENTKYMTELAREHADHAVYAKWRRKLSGPRYQKDDPLFIVSIPRNVGGQAEIDALISAIRKAVRSKKGGKFKKCEKFSDRVELVFELTLYEDIFIAEMWEYGEIPVSVTIWRINDGRRYQVHAWDGARKKSAIHPSLLPPDKRPTRPVQEAPKDRKQLRLKKTATVEQALDWLCDSLGDIRSKHSELTDTAIREAMYDVIVDCFLKPKRGARIPKSFSMDTRPGDLRIHHALSTFVKVATPAAKARKLSPQQRLDLLNERPFDEFFGYSEEI